LGQGIDKRTRARELAMQALYQLDAVNPANEDFTAVQCFFEKNEPDMGIRKLGRQWAIETWRHLSSCDELITVCIMEWKISRLSMLDRAILRLAVYQLKFCPDIPPKVVINEAIELAKKFSTKQSPGFVNGVLDAVLKKIRTGNNI